MGLIAGRDNQQTEGKEKMVYEKVRKILAEQLGADEDSITPDTNVMDDLGLDSLDMAELLSTVEDELNIIIRDGRIRDLTMLGEICAFIEAQMA